MAQHMASRSFTDSVGVEWTVREIGTPSLTQTLAKVLEKVQGPPPPPRDRSLT